MGTYGIGALARGSWINETSILIVTMGLAVSPTGINGSMINVAFGGNAIVLTALLSPGQDIDLNPCHLSLGWIHLSAIGERGRIGQSRLRA